METRKAMKPGEEEEGSQVWAVTDPAEESPGKGLSKIEDTLVVLQQQI